ncbi:MAG: hypothetical protein AB7N76_10465, partial [Planctomycetota bacterium]
MTKLLRLALPLLLAGLVACGSSDTDEPKPKKEQPKPAKQAPPPKKTYPMADSYAGSWEREDGVRFAVEDDGTTVSGKLEADPKERFESYSFALSRESGRLNGKATYVVKEGAKSVEARWELEPAEAQNLAGRTQTAWLDGDEVLLFPDEPEWAEHDFAVKRPKVTETGPVADVPPKQPEGEQPKQPEGEQPKQPEGEQPKQPEGEQPKQPEGEQPK